MVYLKEYRITMPLTVDEYRIGQLWTVANFSKHETGGGDGIEILANRPFKNLPLLGKGQYSEGQYTKKRFYGQKKVGGLIRRLLPTSALIAEEESWNAFPYTRTIITNQYLGESFQLKIESLHLPGKPNVDNAHQLPPEQFNKLEVVGIDIAAPLGDPNDYNMNQDPANFISKKTNRGNLQPGWMETTKPIMTCYKLVSVEFKWFGLQAMVESKIQNIELRLFTLFHREVFCNIDRWFGKTVKQVREYENKIKEELKKARDSKEVHGRLSIEH